MSKKLGKHVLSTITGGKLVQSHETPKNKGLQHPQNDKSGEGGILIRRLHNLIEINVLH
ncbi:hypothetical protein [Calycomorphotria hydatis]|uniref:Uncharacterized protein n=1 Tax=Calycomorphotria hydatis TaxID=2528027 RepID=A0A517T5C7_9PLAN|nr:hypothetical protein [Calycomorphotria hydatis]QDT63585.1 hypothetical protein V22_08090 [Calycomorphotria hydatis]